MQIRRGGAALLLLAAAAVSLLAAEAAVRGLRLADRIHPMPRGLFTGAAAPGLPYRLRPGAEVQWRGVSVRVNDLGLRGPAVPADPPAGERRILALGDSVVYGHRLEETDTFPVRLQQELERRGVGARVLNGAAPGYDTEAELAFLRGPGLALEPDGAVLGVSLNDYADAPLRTPRGFLIGSRAEIPGPAWLADRSELYLLVRWLLRNPERALDGARSGSDAERWAALDRQIGEMHRAFYAEPEGAAWESVRRSLRELRDLAAARDIRLWVVLFPESTQFGPERDRVPQQRWLELCEALDLRCLDLWPAFAAAGGEGLFADVQHPSASGMRVAARVTASWLVRRAGVDELQ